jgi:hypothetical protein
MNSNTVITHKTPVIMLDPASGEAYRVFNANEWEGLSKAIVSSCAAQCGLILYSSSKIREYFDNSQKLCEPKIHTLKEQWNAAPWPLGDMNYFVELPEVHLFIQAFLNSVKTYFDLLVQLLSTENVVNKKLHGFHKKGSDTGGQTLHVLKHRQLNKKIADNIFDLISTQKKEWIDNVINARDSLIHPERGLVQLMFQLEISPGKFGIELKDISKPKIGNKNFDQYAAETYRHLFSFSESFVNILKNS